MGSSVFTLAVIHQWERTNHTPANMVSQGFITACLRSVCSISRHQRPPPVCYKHTECLESLRYAQETVTKEMNVFEDGTGLTQTINQAAREYTTVLKNNIWMNFRSWQHKALVAEVALYGDLLLPSGGGPGPAIRGQAHPAARESSRLWSVCSKVVGPKGSHVRGAVRC